MNEYQMVINLKEQHIIIRNLKKQDNTRYTRIEEEAEPTDKLSVTITSNWEPK